MTARPVAGPAGTLHAGTVVASHDGDAGGPDQHRLDKESERYDLTLRATGRDGQPASDLGERARKSTTVARPRLRGRRDHGAGAGRHVQRDDVHGRAGRPGRRGDRAARRTRGLTMDQDRAVELDARKATWSARRSRTE